MTLKLTQVIALEKQAKATASGALTDTYHTLQKGALFSGQERTYQPKDEEGDRFPPEPVRLQLDVATVLRDLLPVLKRLWDLTLTKDAGNQDAVADIVVNGVVLVPRVPVTTLLFLEKQLVDLHTMVTRLPLLDPTEEWEEVDGVQRTKPTVTTKTKKLPKVITKAPATDKHPAQVDVYSEDQVIGHWSTTKLSGAITATRRRDLLDKVRTLQAAVKIARESANLADVEQQHMADALFSYLTW